MRTIALTATMALAGCQTLGLSSAPPPSEGAPPPASAATPPPAAAISTSGMTGTSSEALLAAWGEPTLKRADNGVELWQYRATSCTLLLYLYPGAGGSWTISHAEAVPGGADETAIQNCAKAAGKPLLKPVS